MTQDTVSERVRLSGRDHDCVVLSVDGMTCGSCANSVSRALWRVPGVVEAEVDLASGQATVRGSAKPADLVAAVGKAGYTAGLAQGEASASGPRARGCGCGC